MGNYKNNAYMPNTYISNDGLAHDYLTKEELAKKLKATTRSVDNYVAQGIIPKIKIGGLTRFNWVQVCASLEGKENKNNGENGTALAN